MHLFQPLGESGKSQSTGGRPIHPAFCDIYLILYTAMGRTYGTRVQAGATRRDRMRTLFKHEGFEVIIWILVIIFLLSIFFDEGIE
jgi:hypothetical protein